jgi:hypothetical protein
MVHHVFFLAKAGFDLGNQRRIGAGKALRGQGRQCGNAFQHLAVLGIHLGEQGRDGLAMQAGVDGRGGIGGMGHDQSPAAGATGRGSGRRRPGCRQRRGAVADRYRCRKNAHF